MQALTHRSSCAWRGPLRADAHHPVVVLGFDGTSGPWLFRSLDQLPNFARVFAEASYGELRSCEPPITVPAWASMFSGLDPGELGLYGFRHRYGPDPEQQGMVHSGLLPPSMLWNRAAEHGKRCVLLGVPPSYPPPAVPGAAVGCFLTPEHEEGFASPKSLAERIRRNVPNYRFDIGDFRNRPAEQTWELLVEMARGHFRVAGDLVREEPFDLFAMVEIGSDRVQHLFWGEGRASGGEGSDAGPLVFEYYRVLDEELGRLLEVLGEKVHLWLMSDHGAQSMRGGVFLNEWLIRHGYLRLKERPSKLAPLVSDLVDWSRTAAWAEGGYVGRIFLNVRGRQSRGVLSAAEADRVRAEIAQGLRATLADGDGGHVPAEVWSATERYQRVTGFPPDLFVYLDGLGCRAFGSVGSGALWSSENDLGPDRANHHPLGFYAYRPPAGAGRGYIGERALAELYPILLSQLGIHSWREECGTSGLSGG